MDYPVKMSVCIPIHDMKGGAEFLWRSINILTEQTFQDFEIVICKEGTMAQNTNACIRKAKGELIKILYLDDMLASRHSLQHIVDEFRDDDMWLITGTDNNPDPYWTDDIETGNNKLGSPSALTFRNKDVIYFDEEMTWLLDCDYYKRMYLKHGRPVILQGKQVIIGVGNHQVTNIISDEEKASEVNYMKTKWK